jgi:hypothetical protein
MTHKAKLYRSVSRSPLVIAAAGLISMFGSVVALAQTAKVSSAIRAVAPVVPQQVRYTGALVNRGGDIVEAVFSIYAAAEGGEALWTETQQVSVGADGVYTVLLGAATEKGLPQTVFAAGQARWLGVTVDRAELPRSPLASVAYAMKAGDAETVGGVAAGSLATKDDLAKLSQTVATAVQALPVVQPQIQVQPEDGPTGSGTMNYVPLWTGAATLASSGIYQSTAGFVGIGTATPRGPLELDTGSVGGTNSTMNLVQTNGASGNYYASIGLYNTNGLIGNLSALGAGYPSGNLFGANDVVFLGGQQKATTNLIFATNTSGALKLATGGFAPANERMRIGATGGVSIGNSYVATDPGAGNLIVSGKVGVGTKTPAAILEVNGTAKFDGLVTFASGQTFPGGGGSGTITGITTTSPLTGSGTSGSVALGLSTSALETTLNGVYAQLGAADTFKDTTTFSGGLVAAGTSGATGVSASSDTGYAVSATTTSGAAIYATGGSGSAGTFSNHAATISTVLASNSANYSSGLVYPTAINGTSTGTSSVGVSGSGTLIGILGNTTTQGGYGVYSLVKDAFAASLANNGTDYPAVIAINYAAGSDTTSPIAIQATAGGIDAVGVDSVVTGNGGIAMLGEAEGSFNYDSGITAIGVEGLSTGPEGDGLVGEATGTGGYAVYAHASGAPDNSRPIPVGVYSLSDQGTGVEGFGGGQSATFNSLQSGERRDAGVWGDQTSQLHALAGVVGTADDATGGYFQNTSPGNSTLYAINTSPGAPSGLFKAFTAATSSGICGIGDGDLSCTGELKSLATTSEGARTVETYATQSAENWMEDYGTGTMEGGVAVVQIDPVFAGTVTADMSYHVFLTPLGDSKGHLYVVKTSATSFEVRESSGGTSSIGFDYKIVAKRRGYEAQRLVDVTDRFNAEEAETKRRMPTVTAVASKGVEEPQMVEHPASLEKAAALRAARQRMRAAGSVAPQIPVVPKNFGTQNKVAKPVVQK